MNGRRGMGQGPWFVHLSLYGGEPVEQSRFLASAKKNRRILEAAARAGHSLVLVDTSCVPKGPDLAPELAPLAADGRLRRIRFPSFGSPSLARFLILPWLPVTLLRLHGALPRHRPAVGGQPVVFSFYNPLASETIPMVVARLLRPRAPRILFYDDALFARRKVDLRLRSLVDQLPWWLARKLPTDVFAVNERLLATMDQPPSRVCLLPCLVESDPDPPPPPPVEPLRLLYAGGLKAEKGIPLLLELAAALPPGVELHISGKGPMQAACAEAAASTPQLHFHGCLMEDAFSALQGRCAILISLHAEMDGVFPFKLIDALHRGMAVVSGPVCAPAWLTESDGIRIIPQEPFCQQPVAATLALLDPLVGFLRQRTAAQLAETRRRIDQHCSVSMLSDRLRLISHR